MLSKPFSEHKRELISMNSHVHGDHCRPPVGIQRTKLRMTETMPRFEIARGFKE
jgi:hypothetical protein